MFELRWVTGGPNRVLEYRSRPVTVDNWGSPRLVGKWSDWRTVPELDVNDAAMLDLVDAGGLPAVGG